MNQLNMKCTFNIQILLLQNCTQLNVFKMYTQTKSIQKCIQTKKLNWTCDERERERERE